MVAQPRRLFMSVAEYLQLDRTSNEARYEYIDGYAVLLAGGTANHATIGLNVASLLRRLLRGGPCRVYNSDLRVRLSEERYVYPDVSVSCDERDRGETDTIHTPRLIVEVLSFSTEAYDRGRKFAFYRECSTIQEYVLIDSQCQAIDVFRREKGSLWTFHAFGPGEDVGLASLNLRFPVDAVYEDVVFASGHDDAPI